MLKTTKKYETNTVDITVNKPTTQIHRTSSSVLSKYMDVFNTFIDYDNKSFELNVLLNKCVYDFNYKYLFEYLVYNIKSTFLFAKDTMYLMFLLNKNMNIVFKYLVNSLLFIGLFFILLLVLSILTLVYMVIGIVSCTLFIITFPFKLIHKLLLKNKKDDEEDNDEDSNGNNNKNNKENINKNNKNKKFFLFFRRKNKNNNRNNNNNNNSKNKNDKSKNNNSKNNNNNRNKNNNKRNIEQEIILNITENEKGKKLSRIKTIILKLLNKVSIIFTKLNKQLQIKFIDKKVTNYNKHATKKMKSRTKVISNSLGIKDNSKERLNSKYQVIKKLSSMVKSCDKSSYFKPKEKLKIKEAKTSVIKGLKNEIKSEKEKLKTTKMNLDKTKSKIKTGTFIKSSNNKNKEKDKEKMKTKEKNEIINKKDKTINKEEGVIEMKTQNKETNDNKAREEYTINMDEYIKNRCNEEKAEQKDNSCFKEQEEDELELWNSFDEGEEETPIEEAEVRSGEIDNIELHGLEEDNIVENGTETKNKNEIEIETKNETTDSFVEKLNEGRNKDKETEVGM